MDAVFFDLSIGIQVALGAGYLAYTTAFAGLRQHHAARDTVFISLAFGAVELLAFEIMEEVCDINLVKVIGATIAPLLAAIIWRKWGRHRWLHLMQYCDIHREDGVYAAWDAIVQSGREVGQMSVHTKNGNILYLHNREKFHGSVWDGLYLGGDGSVVMAVEEEELPDGSKEVRQAVRDEEWGTRMSYIPPSEISRINIRLL